MAVELGASRLLSPYFSSSQIVWTIIIGTIMVAMALGNIYGGRSADKNPNPDILYGRILIAGVWIGLIPVLGKYIIVGLSGLIILSVNSMYLVWAALASAFAVFVFPLFLLGTVTPSLVKYSVQSLDDSGKTVGYLGAFNTIGSIIGTFLPTFVTIPAVGTAITFLIFSGLLIAIAIIYFISVAAGKVRSIVAVGLFIFSCIMGHSDSFAFWNTSLTYEGESIYNYLQVSENDSEVMLSTNVLFGVQSIKKKDGRLSGMYYDYALAAPMMCENPSDKLDILILGNGSGTFATECENYLPSVDIDGVEIDEKITDLARDVYTVDASGWTNRELFASNSEDMISNLEKNISALNNSESSFYSLSNTDAENNSKNTFELSSAKNAELASMMDTVSENLVKYNAGSYILTDDKAPVEVLSMRVLDKMIQEEVGYYKDIYHKKGLKGLLDEL